MSEVQRLRVQGRKAFYGLVFLLAITQLVMPQLVRPSAVIVNALAAWWNGRMVMVLRDAKEAPGDPEGLFRHFSQMQQIVFHSLLGLGFLGCAVLLLVEVGS